MVIYGAALYLDNPAPCARPQAPVRTARVVKRRRLGPAKLITRHRTFRSLENERPDAARSGPCVSCRRRSLLRILNPPEFVNPPDDTPSQRPGGGGGGGGGPPDYSGSADDGSSTSPGCKGIHAHGQDAVAESDQKWGCMRLRGSPTTGLLSVVHPMKCFV